MMLRSLFLLKPKVALGMLLCGLSLACIDFGYEVPEFDASLLNTGAPGSTNGDSDSAGCIEMGMEPTTDGPQLTLRSLNVDRPVFLVAVGDIITWTNSDSQRHTLVAGAPGAELPEARGGFTSPELAPGQAWAFRFCEPRTIFYFCSTHAAQMYGYQLVIE